MKEDLNKFFQYFPWHMNPKDEIAQKRFIAIYKLFKNRIDVKNRKNINILDVAAGTGIAGVALMKALEEKNINVNLTVTDLRENDLKYAYDWAKNNNVKGKIKTKVIDALNISKIGNEFDFILLWGLSTPHFSPDQLLKLFASAGFVLKRNGTFLVEETDRVYRIFLINGYKDLLIEGEKIISFHVGYDIHDSMIKRAYYSYPDNKFITEMKIKMWDVATVSTIGKAIFKEVNVLWRSQHKIEDCADVIVMRKPRKSLAKEIIEG